MQGNGLHCKRPLQSFTWAFFLKKSACSSGEHSMNSGDGQGSGSFAAWCPNICTACSAKLDHSCEWHHQSALMPCKDGMWHDHAAQCLPWKPSSLQSTVHSHLRQNYLSEKHMVSRHFVYTGYTELVALMSGTHRWKIMVDEISRKMSECVGMWRDVAGCGGMWRDVAGMWRGCVRDVSGMCRGRVGDVSGKRTFCSCRRQSFSDEPLASSKPGQTSSAPPSSPASAQPPPAQTCPAHIALWGCVSTSWGWHGCYQAAWIELCNFPSSQRESLHARHRKAWGTSWACLQKCSLEQSDCSIRPAWCQSWVHLRSLFHHPTKTPPTSGRLGLSEAWQWCILQPCWHTQSCGEPTPYSHAPFCGKEWRPHSHLACTAHLHKVDDAEPAIVAALSSCRAFLPKWPRQPQWYKPRHVPTKCQYIRTNLTWAALYIREYRGAPPSVAAFLDDFIYETTHEGTWSFHIWRERSAHSKPI